VLKLGAPAGFVLRQAVAIRRRSLEPEPFLRLIEANRMDQRRSRWDTHDELVDHVTTGREALDRADPDVVLLDLGLPDGDGVDICRQLSQRSGLAIIVVTARGEEPERVLALDAGADDYLVKPFALAELLARLRALLRRRPDDTDEELHFADLHLDPVTREAHRGDRPFTLTRIEFDLLELLLRHPRQVLTREVIFDRVWGYDFGANSNSLEVYIGYLRRKTEGEGGSRVIHTVRGVGYVLREQAP